jgi:succinoglycan biosynthesis transport protein ExoP
MNTSSQHQDLSVRPSYGASHNSFGAQSSRGFQPIPYSDRPQPDKPGTNDSIGIFEYWRIIRRHRGTIILFAFLGLLAAVLYTMPQTPLYRARTVIEVQDINNDFLNTRSVTPVADDNTSSVLTDVQTQMKIIQSEKLIDRVIEKLKSQGKVSPMKSTSRFAALKKLLNLPEDKNNDADYAFEQLALRSLTIHQLGQTRILEVLFTSPDPKFAADFVNVLTSEYVDSNMEARWQMSEKTGVWLNTQLNDMRVKLEKSDAALQQYAERSGLLYTTPPSGGTEKTNVSEDKLRQLQESLSRAEADRAAAQSRYEIGKAAPPESIGDVLSDDALHDLQQKLTDLKRQEAELLSVYTRKDEKVKRVESQIAPLQNAFNAERSAIIEHIRNDYDSAVRREKLLSDDYTKQSAVVTEQAGKSIQYNILRREVDSNRQLYESTLQQVKAASVASAIRASNIRIVDPAKPPRVPFSPSLKANALVGLVGGTMLGVAFILIKSRADRTLRQPGDVNFWTNAPELGVIPSAKIQGVRRLGGKEGIKDGLEINNGTSVSRLSQEPVELITFDKKPSLVAEAFRAVLTSILFVGENGSRPKMLVVTSCGPGDGKTTVVSNLAIAMAEIRRRVLIIDADMRRPRMHQLFDLQNETGLSTLLRDTAGIENPSGCIQETRIPGLFVLTSGPATASAANLLYSQRLPDLLARLRSEFDMVLVDTPPSLQLTDARVLARMTDGVVFVARVGQTTVDATVALHKRFWEDHTRILGTVLNDWNPKSSGNGYYGAASGYYAYQKRYGG